MRNIVISLLLAVVLVFGLTLKAGAEGSLNIDANTTASANGITVRIGNIDAAENNNAVFDSASGITSGLEPFDGVAITVELSGEAIRAGVFRLALKGNGDYIPPDEPAYIDMNESEYYYVITVGAGDAPGDQIQKDYYIFALSMPDEDVALEIKFTFTPDTPANVIVTFDSRGGTPVDPATVPHGGPVAKPEPPTRTGFTFDGWWTEQGTKWDFASNVYENKVLSARWQARSSSGSQDSGSGGSSAVIGSFGDSSSSWGNGGSGGSRGEPAQVSNFVNTALSNPVAVTMADAISAAQAAAQAARERSANFAFVSFSNPGLVLLDIFRSIMSSAGMDVIIFADSITADGRAVDVRISFNPAYATSDLNLHASTENRNAFITQRTFENFFDNTFTVINLAQEESFGNPVRIAVRIDPDLNSDTLVFYIYDWVANTYHQISDPNFWVDQYGYIHFTTTLSGDIVITDRPLTPR